MPGITSSNDHSATYSPCQPLQKFQAEAIPQAAFLGKQVRNRGRFSVRQIQIEPGISQPHGTAHHEGEEGPDHDAYHQHCQQPAAVGL